MKQPIEVLFETCFELLGKRSRTLPDFQQECEKDKIMKEGVEAICIAMVRYTEPLIQEISHLRLIIQNLQQEIAELRKDSVITE